MGRKKRGKCRKERVDPVAANPDNLESNKETGGGAQGTQGLSKNCTSRDSVYPLSRLIRGFSNKLSLVPPWEDQCEWHRITRMTGQDCAVMCNIILCSVSPLSRLIRGFCNKLSLVPPWEDQCEWHRMTRMSGPDCAVMCNIILCDITILYYRKFIIFSRPGH